MKSKQLLLFLPISTGLVLASLLALLFTWSMAVPARAGGNDWYANPVTGDDNNGCTTPSTPCKTVLGAVNKASAGGTVHLAAGTYNENSVWVDKDLTIRGAGADTTIVSGNGGQSLFYIQVTGGVTPTVLMEDMTARGAKDGAIVNYLGGIVTLNRMVVENNTNEFTNSAVYNTGGGRLAVQNSTLRNNTALSGGSVLMNDGGTVVISNTAVINNNSGSSSILHNQNGSNMTLVNVTISNNKGNAVVQPAGGNTATAVNVTIADNEGVGILNYATVNVKNSILAHNSQNCANDTGSGNVLPVSQGYNIDTAGSCNFIAAGDQSSADPQLFPLMEHSGAWMRPFTAGSPARNKGTNTGCPADDQSGTSRPQESVCDVGAFEYDPANPPKMKVYLPLIIRP